MRFEPTLRRLVWLLLLQAACLALARAGDRPFLWQVSAPGATVYLFGSLHVCNAACYPLPGPVNAALERAEVLAVELDPADAGAQARILERALYPAHDSLDRHLDPAVLAEVRAAMQKLGAPFEPMLRMRPWMAGTSLAMVAAMQAGYQPDKGVDLWLIERARAQGKQILALETADQQIDALEGLGAKEQALLIRQGARLIRDDSLRGTFDALVAAWRRGDGRSLDRLMRAGLEEEPDAEAVFERVLIARNAGMAAHVESLLAAKRPALVVVGAGHLVGRGSLVERLAAKGWAVRQVE
jgi:hypothetical protein